MANDQRFRQWIARDIARLQIQDERLTTVRAAIFVLGLAGCLALSLRGGTLAAGVLAAVAIAAFAFFVRAHWRIRSALDRRAASAAIVDDRVARRELDWTKLAEHPALPAGRALPRYFQDLDLVGPRSILKLANWTVSDEGWWALVELFVARADGAEVDLRAARVRALARRPILRRQLWERLGRGTLASSRVRALLEHPVTHGDPWPWILVLGSVQLVAVALFALFLAGLVGAWFVFPLALGFFVQKAGEARFHGAYDRALELESSLERLLSTCLWLETRSAGAPLDAMLAPFREGSARPSRLLKRLARVIALLGFRGNPLAHAIVNALVPWDWWLATRLERLREEARGAVPLWTSALARLEAAASLAELAEALVPDAKDRRWAECLAPGHDSAFEAEGLAHPLIPRSRRVANPARLDARARCLLVTGSNMAGKSTYLRTIAVNWLLARAGAPVLAERARLRVDLELHTCLRIADSVTDEVSSFYAEVRALKQVLEATARGPVLYFIDEIFRGTNQRERVQGSAAYLEELVRRESFGLVATHDLELARLAEKSPRILNFHFEETIRHSAEASGGAEMIFTYTLKDGPSTSTNALRIMDLAGLPTRSTLVD